MKINNDFNRSRGDILLNANRSQKVETLKLDTKTTQTFLSLRSNSLLGPKHKDIYLPKWSRSAVGFPKVLLQSSLWSAGKLPELEMDNTIIATFNSNEVISYTGPRLNQYDRRIFGACLDIYGDDRPLAKTNGDSWILISFYQMARSMGLSYTKNTHNAIHHSLLRLSRAALEVHDGKKTHQVPRLLEVKLDPNISPKPRDRIIFRLLEDIASLYQPNAWCEVPKREQMKNSLRSWLIGFFSAQSTHQALSLRTLQGISGLSCRPNDFRNNLMLILDELKNPEISNDVRVAHYQLGLDKKSISITLDKFIRILNIENHSFF